VTGDAVDEVEARNRAQIEAQLGRQISASAVSMQDVIAMTQAGVAEELIVNHVTSHGAAAPLSTDDVITLSRQGVSPNVIKAMQAPPPRPVVVPASAPVIVEEHHYGYPAYYPYPRYRYRHHHHHRRPPPRSGVSWGVSIRN
jgi:hypothetical protein